MTKLILAVVFAAVLTTPVSAQVFETPTTTTVIVPPGSPGVVTRQPGSTGEEGVATYSPTGRAADSISNDSAASGDEGQPSRMGSTGSGGGK
ncbi:hypothetical protein [Methylobacterium sp. J-070]|uniref:hypothetical protein n=1 Tax=Methylobacterium sp. J-070 TaxID=2836650 RepID=UPI001FBAD114|nr:hypothetical protein [Methylobacterium sp. J-070]MCJ2049817.1 hypothetical protein [Methylobacterium sp. J-070]